MAGCEYGLPSATTLLSVQGFYAHVIARLYRTA